MNKAQESLFFCPKFISITSSAYLTFPNKSNASAFKFLHFRKLSASPLPKLKQFLPRLH